MIIELNSDNADTEISDKNQKHPLKFRNILTCVKLVDKSSVTIFRTSNKKPSIFGCVSLNFRGARLLRWNRKVDVTFKY